MQTNIHHAHSVSLEDGLSDSYLVKYTKDMCYVEAPCIGMIIHCLENQKIYVVDDINCDGLVRFQATDGSEIHCVFPRVELEKGYVDDKDVI